MSAAMVLQVWGDTMVTTAALVLAVLLIRKPFARHFGPQLTYMLWLVPALRLFLPPLPFADAVPVAAAQPASEAVFLVPVDALADAPVAAGPLWSFADLVPYIFAIWMAGVAFVLVAAWLSHRRFRREVLGAAVELEPIGKIRLVMTDMVDGPVAFGLWNRFVAVPHDFFARYAAEERALAIDHELAHHRHGDLWANAAALLLLASQWFNPFAWRAIRAFRFDQEAACDARVLTMSDAAPRHLRTARYATAIAKAAVGSRLSLAAPMAVHDNLQERLTMLTREDISKKRGLIGKLLVGGATLAVLTTTATLIPAATASAQADIAEPPAPPEAPLPPEAPAAPEAPEAPGFMVFTEHADGDAGTDKDGKKREVRRIVIRQSGEGEGKDHPAVMFAPTDGKMKRIEIRTPGGLSRDDVIATLKEQGIAGAQAEAIADKLEAKRRERIRTVMAPMPPMAPLPPMAIMPHGAWKSPDGKAMVMGKCGDGSKPAPIVNREEVDGNKREHIYMIRCGDTAETKAARLSALKKAREGFDKGRTAQGLSDEMRAKVAADLDKAIADLEKAGN
ncbi:peptidase M56, BlaR1 [Sphingopyxis sp. H050]|jgi:bla regulator protein blaR1|uniref:M56 family metallopeptidase n=1 Tax=Sphingopyxis sp. H050 TaxID=1759072 RepID=UPI000736CCE8|nr:M56 family metallopeptidase [Sphingopyxis sp. H050]KTE22693.1 peptidase M56, BlaR1 [Sphingopyxis sp. H050]